MFAGKSKTKVDSLGVHIYFFVYQFRIYAKYTCVHAIIAMKIFHTCMVENCQPEWSVTWTQCHLAFLICAMCACA